MNLFVFSLEDDAIDVKISKSYPFEILSVFFWFISPTCKLQTSYLNI